MTYYKNTKGFCPYCNANNCSILEQRRPFQKIHKCNSCNKYMVYNERNGVCYPLSNPMDSKSLPQI